MLSASTCAAASGLLGGEARGQAASPLDTALMRPALDGDPLDPPRFRSPRKGGESAPTRFGQLPNFGFQPALGAGTTGFDSTNARKRRSKAGQPGRPAAAADPSVPAPAGGSTAASSDTTTKPDPAATPVAAPFLPKQLQPAGAPLAARIYNQMRPGAPLLAPDAVIATLATIPPSRRQPPEDRPFDPIGIQVGAFNFRPAFEYSRGYDTNVPRNATPPAASSWFNIYATDLLVNSNWERHEFTAALRGSYT